MDARARSELLKKISCQGFSIEDYGSRLILRPRGAENSAAITVEENDEEGWKVIRAEGKYTGFARGYKQTYFENNLNLWAVQARLQLP